MAQFLNNQFNRRASKVVENVGSEFQHAEKDHRWFIQQMEKEVGNIINTTITHTQSFMEAKVNKYDVLKQINEAAQQAVEYQSVELRIYYTGHGHKDTGDWATVRPMITVPEDDEDSVSLLEVINEVKKTQFDQVLRITTDCCYSGHWCYKALELYDSGKIEGM